MRAENSVSHRFRTQMSFGISLPKHTSAILNTMLWESNVTISRANIANFAFTNGLLAASGLSNRKACIRKSAQRGRAAMRACADEGNISIIVKKLLSSIRNENWEVAFEYVVKMK